MDTNTFVIMLMILYKV